MFKEILKPFASLRLTVVLLAMAFFLVYAGTWAQVGMGNCCKTGWNHKL